MKRWLTANADKLDIIHTHGLWMMPNVYPGWLTGDGRAALVVSPRGTLSAAAMKYSRHVKRVFWLTCQRNALHRASGFHATCDSELEDIRRAGFRQPIAMIPNGIDVPPVEQSSGRRFSSRKLLFLGRIHPKKGLDLAIRCWQKIQDSHKDWEFLIVGKGLTSYTQSLRSLAKEIGAERVTFQGPLYGTAKHELLRSAGVFILPTRNENFGIAVAEALAQGTPVITTRDAPWVGLSVHRCGWWADTTVDGLCKAMHEACALSPETLMRMGQRGRDWMVQDFSWEVIGGRMAEFYEWLGGVGRRPSFVQTS